MNKLNPDVIKVIIFDWHGMIDHADFKLFKMRLAQGLNTPISELQKNLESLGVYQYLKGLKPSSMFWLELKKIYPGSEEFIETERIFFLKPIVDREFLQRIRKTRQFFETALCADLSQDKAASIRKYCKKQLRKTFDYVSFSGDIVAMKRDNLFLEKFLHESGFAPIQCLFIDDNLKTLEEVGKKGFQTLFFIGRINLFEELDTLINQPVYAS